MIPVIYLFVIGLLTSLSFDGWLIPLETVLWWWMIAGGILFDIVCKDPFHNL